MSSKWLLTLRHDCDLGSLEQQLGLLNVQLVKGRKPMPIGSDEIVIYVQAAGATLPVSVEALDGVVRINPSSRMTRGKER